MKTDRRSQPAQPSTSLQHATRWPWMLWLLIALLPTPGFANPDCRKLFQGKQYLRSARCFEGLLKLPKPPKKLTGKARTLAGRILRNIALAYRTAARHAKPAQTEQAAYYRERALQALQQYLDHQLHERPQHKLHALALQQKLQTQIQYAPLTVLAPDPKALIELKGFTFHKKATGRLVSIVRPGRYTATYTLPNHPKPLQHSFQVSPATPCFVQLKHPSKATSPTTQPTKRPTKRPTTQPVKRRNAPTTRPVTRRPPPVRRRLASLTRQPPKRKAPPKASKMRPLHIVGWSLLGLGVASGIAGGFSYGFGHSAEIEKRKLNTKSSPTHEDTTALLQLHDRATTLMPAGVVLFACAGAFTAAGIILLVLPSPPSAPPPSSPSKGRTLHKQHL